MGRHRLGGIIRERRRPTTTMWRRGSMVAVIAAMAVVFAVTSATDTPQPRSPRAAGVPLAAASVPGAIEGYRMDEYPTTGAAKEICATVGADNAPPLVGALNAARYIERRFATTVAGTDLPYWEGMTCRTRIPAQPPTAEQAAKKCVAGVITDSTFASQCWSNHAQGRAVDILVKVRPGVYETALGNRIVDWLLATDAEGNAQANARRLGIQQIIWNGAPRRPGDSNELAHCWDTQDRAVDSSAVMPLCETVTNHKDHIHIDFTIDGANGRTSFWEPEPIKPSVPGSSP